MGAAGSCIRSVPPPPLHALTLRLLQDVSGGKPVLVEGTALPLWGLEIDPENEKQAFRAWSAGSGKQEAKEFMGGFGISSVIEQLADLKLGELLDTPPPGFDEAVAIGKVSDASAAAVGLASRSPRCMGPHTARTAALRPACRWCNS